MERYTARVINETTGKVAKEGVTYREALRIAQMWTTNSPKGYRYIARDKPGSGVYNSIDGWQ